MTTRYELEGFDAIETGIRRTQADAAYLTMTDCTDYRRPEPCGRYDFEEPSEAPPPPEDEDDRPGGLFDDADDEDESDGPPDDEADPSDPPDRAQGAIDWIRETSKRHTTGDPQRKFRVKVYAPKANTLLFSGQFLVRNDDAIERQAEDALNELARSAPTPSTTIHPDALAEASIFKAVKALGEGYAQWTQIVLAGMAQMQVMNNAVQKRQDGMIRDRDANIEKILGALISLKVEIGKAQAQDSAEVRAQEQKGEIAKKALDELSKLGTAYMVSQGIPQELAEVMGQAPELRDLLTNKEFRSVLTDPDFRKLVSNPQHQNDLAGMIRSAVAYAKAQEQAKSAVNTATENATSNPEGA